MNILTFEDAENYLKFQQVYFKKEICDINMKTVLAANYVHKLNSVSCYQKEDRFYLEIECKGHISPICTFYKSKLEFFAWIRTNFIPLSELIHVYNQK